MRNDNIQIDINKVIQRYDARVGELTGRIMVLETQIESMQEYIDELETELEDDKPQAKAKVVEQS